MTTFPSDGALYGIAARLRGHVLTPPHLRYASDASEVLEFQVKLVEDWPPSGPLAEEVIVVRYGGQQRELDRWLTTGRHVLLSGILHVARWTGAQDGKDRARLVLEATEVQPLDEKPPNPSRAAAYAPRPPQPADREAPTRAEQLDRLEAMVSAAEDSPKKADPPKAMPRTQAERARRYDEIYGKDGDAA
jgi:single-stranded DNA-binding protein